MFYINYLPIFVNSFLYSYIVFCFEIENSTTAIIAMQYDENVIDRWISNACTSEIPPGHGTVEVCYIV